MNNGLTKLRSFGLVPRDSVENPDRNIPWTSQVRSCRIRTD